MVKLEPLGSLFGLGAPEAVLARVFIGAMARACVLTQAKKTWRERRCDNPSAPSAPRRAPRAVLWDPLASIPNILHMAPIIPIA